MLWSFSALTLQRFEICHSEAKGLEHRESMAP